MWSYFGSKSKLIPLYPKPKFDLIIEPFAGSARYALEYFYKDVILYDKYDVIIKIWKYLQQAKPHDILSLPDIKGMDDRVSNYTQLCDEEKWLMGFCIRRGSSKPRDNPGKFNNWNDREKRLIAKNLHKIRHWKFYNTSYENIPNAKATWYIDPPYQDEGRVYVANSGMIDYQHLGKWCMEREGQVIVCESGKADWLPFKPISAFFGARKTSSEAIWSNLPTIYDVENHALFEDSNKRVRTIYPQIRTVNDNWNKRIKK